jgi:hypothetical protein
MIEENSSKTKVQLTPLLTACFMQDEKMLINVIFSRNHFSEDEIQAALKYNHKIKNQKVDDILATAFPVAHITYQKDLEIRQQDTIIKSLMQKIAELEQEKNLLLQQNQPVHHGFSRRFY